MQVSCENKSITTHTTQFRRKGPSFICMPNLKRVVWIVRKLWGSLKFRNWITWPRPRPSHLVVSLCSLRRYSVCNYMYLAIVNALVVYNLCTLLSRMYLSLWLCIVCMPMSIILYKLTPKWVNWPLSWSICGRYADSSVPYLCTEFEADSSIRSKVIRGGPKISKLGHVTLGHALLNLKRWICLEIHLRILTAKLYASSLIRCWVIDESNVNGPFNGKIGNAHAPCHVTW